MAGTHNTALYRATMVETDYPFDTSGSKVWIARCSCGWSVIRQLERATREQRAKHLKATADA